MILVMHHSSEKLGIWEFGTVKLGRFVWKGKVEVCIYARINFKSNSIVLYLFVCAVRMRTMSRSVCPQPTWTRLKSVSATKMS